MCSLADVSDDDVRGRLSKAMECKYARNGVLPWTMLGFVADHADATTTDSNSNSNIQYYYCTYTMLLLLI
jgi:hypothetical protein